MMFINQKPGAFAPGVLWCENPIFKTFLGNLKLFSFKVRAATSEEYSDGYGSKNIMKAGVWPAEQIMLGQPDDIIAPVELGEEPILKESTYITVWCGMAVFKECISENSEDWAKIQEVWRLL